MLKFNLNLLYGQNIYNNLNTSYVKVQLNAHVLPGLYMYHLNTSYVKVQLIMGLLLTIAKKI